MFMFFQCIRFTHHSHSQRTCAHNDTRIDKIHRGDTFRYRLSKYVHRLFGWFFSPVQIHENRITEETKICGQIAEHWVFTTVQKLAFLFGMHCACIGMHCVKSYHVETKINTKKKQKNLRPVSHCWTNNAHSIIYTILIVAHFRNGFRHACSCFHVSWFVWCAEPTRYLTIRI